MFDAPIGSDSFYTMFRVNGKDVAALYQLGQDMPGIPAHWMAYVTVASADDTAARAKQLGGTVLGEPFDVMTYGRMAVLQDPAGARFAVWEPRSHIGAQVGNEVGTNCWNELSAADNATAGPFYSELFGWEQQVTPMGPISYTMFMHPATGQPVGGMMPVTPEWEGVPPHWMVYFSVADCDATAAKTAELGGKVLHGPFDVDPVGRMAVLMDPQGAALSVIKLK